MVKRFIGVMLSAFICCTFMPSDIVSFADDYCPFSGGGTGTEKDPYKISNAYDLNLLAELINDSEVTDYNLAYYIQTNDIDLENENFTPIGTYYNNDNSGLVEDSAFCGHYDGNYHSVYNLNVDCDEKYTGLFGRAGCAYASTKMNCEIVNLSVYGSVKSTNNSPSVGGIVGEIGYGATIKNCSFSGNVSGNGYVGGITGFICAGGGILSCYSNVSIDSKEDAGGIVSGVHIGKNGSSKDAEIKNCYAVGEIKAEKNKGGIFSKLIDDKVVENTLTVENNCYISSLADNGSPSNINGCSKLNDEFMRNANEILGLPFVHNDDKEINNGYPVFEWQSKPYQFNGSGTAEDPYQISSREELEKMRDLVNSKFFTKQYYDKCYIQTADIDLENEKWIPIGTRMINNIDWSSSSFCGSYNGNCHTIKNLYVNETDKNNYSGLFGSFGGNGVIENLIVYGKVNSNGGVVGGIAGEVVNSGSIIRNCAFIGDVAGNSNNIGGISGVIWQNGTIENCYHIGNVSALTESVYNIGGIVGQLLVGSDASGTASVKNCYHVGKITGTSKGIGSIAGDITHRQKVDGEIYVENCYALKGQVNENISGNYKVNYDVSILSENMMRNAYSELGEAFVQNPDINFNDGYPVFSWQMDNFGDVNGDGVFNISDVVTFQRWLLADKNVQLKNWKNADLCQDNQLDSFDLVIMKKQLIGK